MNDIKEKTETEPLVDFNNLDVEDMAILDIELRLSAISCACLLEYGLDEIADYVAPITSQSNLDLAVTQRGILNSLL
jgi:hypothetical protein